MLTPAELTATANGFGVGYDQVRRDHLISHVLASLDALTRGTDHRPVFFGGTALARTWLPDGRLSEDIDLYVAHRTALVAALEDRRGLIWQLRREFPDAAWNPPPSAVSDPDPASLVTGSIQVRIQILRSEGGFDAHPTEERDLALRYGDAGSARLPVPTLAAFTAMKTAAWYDRKAPAEAPTSAAPLRGFELP
jgi:hypothetical protein